MSKRGLSPDQSQRWWPGDHEAGPDSEVKFKGTPDEKAQYTVDALAASFPAAHERVVSSMNK